MVCISLLGGGRNYNISPKNFAPAPTDSYSRQTRYPAAAVNSASMPQQRENTLFRPQNVRSKPPGTRPGVARIAQDVPNPDFAMDSKKKSAAAAAKGIKYVVRFLKNQNNIRLYKANRL